MGTKLKPICWHQSRKTIIDQINDKKDAYKKIIVITDENVYKAEIEVFDALSESHLIKIPAGEQSKDISVIMNICQQMATLGAGRDTLVIGIGGGVITDISGFVASIYQRGVDLVFVPTTLLAMVDASIGGKNGIDAPWGKNQIGTIYMPKEIFLCGDLIEKLPEIELRNGMAEMLKHGIIRSPEHFRTLSEILESPVTWGKLNPEIRDSAEIKMDVIRDDIREHNGARIKLNLGHTFAHAIEKKSKFAIPHGKAVAMGTIMATDLGLHLGITDPTDAEIIKSTMWKLFPESCPYKVAEIWPLMQTDKKRSGSSILFVIPERIGSVIIHPIELNNPGEFFFG